MGETLTRMSARRRATLTLGTPAEVDIFTRVLTHGPIGRIDVGYQTGLSQAKVTKTVTPLIDAGFLVESDQVAPRHAPGRPVRPLSVVPEALRAIGIMLGPDRAVGVAVTMTAEVTHTAHADLPDTSVDGAVDAIDTVVRRLLHALGDGVAALAGIGVIVSGEVDSRVGVVRDAPGLRWSDVPLGPRLTRRLDADIVISNDVRTMTLAEDWFGVGVDADPFAVVSIGDTVGCGLYVNGDSVVGAHGIAGGLAHLPVADCTATCSCGRRGCIEAVASLPALLASLRPTHGDLTIAEAVALAASGDTVAGAVIERAGSAVGAGVAALANLLDPEVVLVAGEGVGGYAPFADQIRAEFAARAIAATRCDIVVVDQSVEARARAAGACVIRSTIRQRFPW
jgi:predicted NBD/HSP70 family sugar kinase